MSKRVLVVAMLWLGCAIVLGGCGGGGTAGGGAGLDVLSSNVSATPTPTPFTPPPGSNAIDGRVTFTASRASVTVALFQAAKQVGATQLTAAGTFSFPSVADGSYTLVVSGQGLRPQQDVFNLRNGSKVTANYVMSSSAGNPSAAELQGAFTKNLRLLRAIYGWRMSGLVTQSQLDFNRRSNFFSAAAKSTRSIATVAIPVKGAQFVAVDRTGAAWVSVNDALSGPGAKPTTSGVVQISTQGTVLGQFSTSALANSGGGVVGTDASLDVAVFNPNLSTLGVLPAGGSTPSSVSIAGSNVSVNAVVNQSVPNSAGTSRLLVAANAGNTPQLMVVQGNAVATSVTLPNAVPTSFQVRGLLADPNDNTIYMVGFVPTVGGAGHLFHLTSDGTGLLEDINLGVLVLFGQQNLARDASGNLWMLTSTSLIEVSGAVGARTVTPIAALHKDGSAFSVGSAIATDGLGHIWACDTLNANVTEFDSSGNALVTLATGTSPNSVAIDSNNNVWIACAGTFGNAASAVVDEIVVGGPVAPNTTPRTVTLPNGSTVLETPGPNGSAFLQSFPQSTFQSGVTFGPTTVSGTTSTVSSTGSFAQGPSAGTRVGTYDASAQTYTTNTTTVDSQTGVTTTAVMTLTPQGTGSATASTDNGTFFNVAYSFAPDGSGKVLLNAKVTFAFGSGELDITATYNLDGTVSDFTITDTATGIVTTSQMNANGQFNAQAFNIGVPGVPIAFSNTDSSTSIVQAIAKVISGTPPTSTTPQIATQFLSPVVPTVLPVQTGTVPGSNTLITTVGTLVTSNSIPIATIPGSPTASLTDVLGNAPQQQGLNAPMPGTPNDPPGDQGATSGADASGGDEGGYIGASGSGSGGGGFDTFVPSKERSR